MFTGLVVCTIVVLWVVTSSQSSEHMLVYVAQRGLVAVGGADVPNVTRCRTLRLQVNCGAHIQ